MIDISSMLSRKEFLIKTLGLGGASLILANIKTPTDFMSFDLHSHVGRLFLMGNPLNGTPLNSIEAFGVLKEVPIMGAFVSLVADSKLLKAGPNGISVLGNFKDGEAWDDYKAQLQFSRDFYSKQGIHLGLSADAVKKGPFPSIYMAVEGGDFLEGKLDRIEEAYEDGIRSIQLVHYVQNNVGDLQTSTPIYKGLSPFGKDLIRKMNKSKMLIDVAHASYETTKDVVNISHSPIMLSHSILSMEPNRPIAIRSISPEHALLVSKNGGLIGAWPSGFNKSFEDFVDNIARLVDLVGIDHVGLGTDMDQNFKAVLSSYKQFPSLYESLLNKGFHKEEAEKIMGRNAFNLLKKVIH